MSKDNRPTGFKDCRCDKCKAEAHARSGSQHRRCGGPEAGITPKRTKKPSSHRGVWQ